LDKQAKAPTWSVSNDWFAFFEHRRIDWDVATDMQSCLKQRQLERQQDHEGVKAISEKILPIRQAESECPIWVEAGCAPIWPQPLHRLLGE